ncbi:uncharacterized protein LOC129987653 [Argiope bruennichi]|uniref:uncharacterized protein LOC129987653 n=1 Tax=Argiope bruennichi TaxID=94029 RepID=UPI002495051F|nr:uncharacterized protein LOC129987653 [Argiope bruennichi]
MSIYLTLLERQLKTAEIDEAEWVSQLLSLLPLDLAHIIAKEPEDKAQDYEHIKQVLLERFKIKTETYRQRFVSHQKKPNALWKELIFDLEHFLDGWLSGSGVTDFTGLKKLLITDQIKKRVPSQIRDHFLDVWSEFVDPFVLAEKLDHYESVRTKSNFVKFPERKMVERNRPFSPKEEEKYKATERMANAKPNENKSWRNLAPQRNWRGDNFDQRKQLQCYECLSTTHLRPNCPQLKKNQPTEQINHVIWVKQPLDLDLRCLPLARVRLNSPEFGEVVTKAAIVDSSLDQGIYLLSNATAELLNKRISIATVNAVTTRSQKKGENAKGDGKARRIGSGTGGKNEIEPEMQLTEESLPPIEIGEGAEDLFTPFKITQEEFSKAQMDCGTLEECRERVNKGHEGFKKEKGLFFRVTKDHLGNPRSQLIVPKKFRPAILEMCHESTSAHLGVTKTKDRALKYYFWPNCVKDIENYVRSCDPCQRIGKPREKTKAPLKLVPVISEIFSKLNIDCVGPLPISEKNNRYLLTAMCMSSKYPDAIPIEDLTSITVINAMLNVFSRMGFPREIQCDWGTSFTSYLTTEFFDKFGIKVTHSSVRHPQTNPVERFHKTIKRLLKVLCLESGKDWEKNLPATLLALRTVTHESTGFSPAELVHGKNLRTPEVLLYEHWVAPKENETAVAKYMYDLINRMRRCQDIAVTRMLETRDKRKLWYDKNAVHRQYKSGDQVLVLAASMPNKLSVQWIGPGKIQSQLSETNYIVKMTGKEAKPQIFHVNLLKPYHKRLAEVNLVFHEEKVNVETENDLEIAYPTGDVNAYDFEEISRSSNLEERLTTEQIGELKELLHKHKTVFSNKPGKTHLVEHDIELISNQPVRSKPYRTSQRQAEILKSEIKQMLDLKIIEMGQSDYTSPMLLVEAPGKAPRPCIDYRKLNSVIKTEYFPLPNLEERVERVSAAKFITVLDLAKGYWQIPMTKNASRLAAFVTNFGTYLPLRMPFGLVNAPYFFSKMMAEILGNCEKYAVPYLDDIAIYSETWEEHLKHVDEVLKRIGAANLTVKPSKCQLAQSRTKYLGHMVGDGVRTPAEAKIKAVIDFPTPKTKTQIRAFLGLAGYYAHYVEKFSVIATPLTNALKGRMTKEQIRWTPECEQAFQELKMSLTKKPVLHAPDYTKKFIVQTDASDVGMGVVMSQLDSEGKEHPILYLSKKFSDAEKKYSTTEKECASIVYAIKKLKFYLDGQHFTIVTDHNPLVWLKTNAGNNPRLMRWSLALQPYNYTVTHKPGSKHQNADGLSRCNL